MQRKEKRSNNQLREISIIPGFNMHAEGSAEPSACILKPGIMLISLN